MITKMVKGCEVISSGPESQQQGVAVQMDRWLEEVTVDMDGERVTVAAGDLVSFSEFGKYFWGELIGVEI